MLSMLKQLQTKNYQLLDICTFQILNPIKKQVCTVDLIDWLHFHKKLLASKETLKLWEKNLQFFITILVCLRLFQTNIIKLQRHRLAYYSDHWVYSMGVEIVSIFENFCIYGTLSTEQNCKHQKQ